MKLIHFYAKNFIKKPQIERFFLFWIFGKTNEPIYAQLKRTVLLTISPILVIHDDKILSQIRIFYLIYSPKYLILYIVLELPLKVRELCTSLMLKGPIFFYRLHCLPIFNSEYR